MKIAILLCFSAVLNSAFAVEPAAGASEANSAFYRRSVDLLKLYESEIGTAGNINSTWGVVGSDAMTDATNSLRRIAAGLKLLELHETQVVPSNFPALVEAWVSANVVRLNDVGTDKDYDFALIQIANLIYQFRDKPNLLTNNAIWSLIYTAKPPGAATVYFDGQSITENLRAGAFCETENHVLMAYVWKYLINQWIHRNYRGDSRVAAYFKTERHVNGPELENLMLRMVGRITRNDYFETNARAYQAFTFQALLTLYSYTENQKLKTACLNAINFTVAKYAFQSFEGMRYTMQRRNWTYKGHYGIFENDYMPSMIGVLTADYRTDTRLLDGTQQKGFALWTILNEYRVPEIIHDFILNKDNHQAGYGFWAKMQARYTSVDYPIGGYPRYWPNTDVNGYVIHAIEMHYGNRYMMNNSGGDWMPYYLYPAAIGVGPFYWTSFDAARNYDIITKPNTVLVQGFEGPTVINNLGVSINSQGYVSPSNCNGVYKGFGFGKYATAVLPEAGGVHVSTPFVITNPHSKVTLDFYTINTPIANYYAVTGEVKYGTTNLYGFYEIVHASKYANVDAFISRVKAQNQTLGEDILGIGSIPNLPKYRLAVSGEVVVPNPYYLMGTDGNAFIEIYPYNGTAIFSLDDYTFNGSVQAVVSKQPLLEVDQLDASDRFTGVKYVNNSTEGVLDIYNPFLNQRMIIDARDYGNPSVSGTYRASTLPPRLIARTNLPAIMLLLQ